MAILSYVTFRRDHSFETFLVAILDIVLLLFNVSVSTFLLSGIEKFLVRSAYST